MDWDKFLRQEVHLWKVFHEYWIQVAKEGKIPVYFFRYEDCKKAPTAIY
jgi:predicted alpha/beta hydrolase